MANRTRTAAAIAAAAILASSQASAAAESTVSAVVVPAETSHLRSSSPAINAAIKVAIERSVTFRDMVAAINASDSYVFVNEGDCGHGVHACLANVGNSGSHRFLFVLIDSRKSGGELLASIGHELRHTIEVIGDPTVRTNAAMFFLYERIGQHGRSGQHETLDAMTAGNAVRAEVKKFNREAKSE
jgi:plastocyanin